MKCLSLLTPFLLLQQAAKPLSESALAFDFPIKPVQASDLPFELSQDSGPRFQLAQGSGPRVNLMQGSCSPHKSAQASDPLYDTTEAAEYIGVKVNTLTVWRCMGRYDIEYIKVGRLVKYRKSALDAFLESRTRGGIVS